MSNELVIEKSQNSITEARDQNELFPIFLKLDQLSLLIVGGGKIALEKLNAILCNSPNTIIELIAPEIHPDIFSLEEEYPSVLKIQKRAVDIDDLEGKQLMIVAVNDIELSTELVDWAHRKQILVNVADKPDLCDFYLSSIVQKGHLKIAISTNGKSPTIAKRLKVLFQMWIPDDINGVLNNMHTLRQNLRGDFQQKVKHLNEITENLVASPQKKKSNNNLKHTVRINRYLFLAIILIAVLGAGYFVSDWGILQEFLQQHADKKQLFLGMMLAGFFAQLVDGALGLGFGLTCTTIMMQLGLPLPLISSTIHTAEIFTTGASGLSHLRYGNVNKRLLFKIVFPGMLGALLGAVLLVWLGDKQPHLLKPIIATYTLLLGLKILISAFKRFIIRKPVKRLGWLAGFGGFLDSFGGGGWGPIVTSTLLAKGKTPRYVIGTVNLTEFFVTLISTVAFVTLIGINHWWMIVALILGGVFAAPLAAKLAGKLPTKVMLMLVGGVVVIWSLQIIFKIL